MSSIANVASQVSPPIPAPVSSAGSDTVSSDTFMQLLVAQMQNQDPLNPQDPTQFASELAQFSSLEQLVNVNTNLQNMSSGQSLSSLVSASGFIGKTATVNGNSFDLASGSSANLQYNLPSAAADTSLAITNSSGALVRTVDLGAQAAGNQSYSWDGTQSDGSAAPAGAYSFTVTSVDNTGQAITATPSVSGVVSGVQFQNGQPMLQIGDQSFALTDLTSIQ